MHRSRAKPKVRKKTPKPLPDDDPMSSIRALVLTGDHHCGSRLALYPDDPVTMETAAPGVPLDEGGHYVPSRLQQRIWGYWREFWDVFLPSVAPNGPIGLLLGGECVEGVHHGVTTLVSHNLADQMAIADAVLGPVTKRMKGRLVMLRGTEAHSGISGSTDETMARRFGALRNQDGQSSRYEARLTIQGWRLHATHHIGVGIGTGSTCRLLASELGDCLQTAAQWGSDAPHIIARFHTHQGGVVQIPSSQGLLTGISVPGWQLKTPFVWKKRWGRVAPPQFGAAVVVFHHDHYTTHLFCRALS